MTRITTFDKQTSTHGLDCVNHYWRVLLDWKDIRLIVIFWLDLLCITDYLTFAVCYSLESVNDLRLCVTPEHVLKGIIDMIYACFIPL